MRRSWFYSACLALVCTVALGPAPAFGQSLQLAPAPGGAVDRPTASATAVAEAPAIDGDVLADSVWQQATPIAGFKQYQPDEGEPVSERTEVRMIFTRDTLFVGVVCYDSDPAQIIVSDSRRDSSLDNTDSFRMIFDTFQDVQNGFVFGTNPAGVEYDGQVTNEGQGGGGLARQPAVGIGERIQPQLGRRMGSAHQDHGDRLDGRVRHPVQDPALPGDREPGVGRQFPAQHPPQERGSLLGPHPAAVQPLSGVDRGHRRGPAATVVPQLQADSVRARARSTRSAKPRPRPIPTAMPGWTSSTT